MSNQHNVGDTQRSSKSRSRRKPAARTFGYRRRLNDTVMGNQNRKRPNAQKHGVFAVNPVVPGEDPQEFQELLSALVEEWQPSGPTEEDAVFNLAVLMWRKLRAQKFLRAKLIANTIDPRHPAFNEAFGLSRFTYLMRFAPETAFEKHASNHLRADKIEYLNQKFPRSNYKSTSEWAEAVINEIESVLLPDMPEYEAPEPGTKINNLTAAFRQITLESKLFISIIHAGEFLEHELDLRERLDAMIARAVKHLSQTKAMKQMLRQTGALKRADQQPRKIAARNPPDRS